MCVSVCVCVCGRGGVYVCVQACVYPPRVCPQVGLGKSQE